MAGGVGGDGDRAACRFDPGQDHVGRLLRSHRPVGIVDPHAAGNAGMHDRRQAAIGQPFGIDHRFGGPGIERAIGAARHIDQVQRGRGGIVLVDAGHQAQLAAVGGDFDIADLARRFDFGAFAVGEIDDADPLVDILIVDLRRRRAGDDREAPVARYVELVDVARHGDLSRLLVDPLGEHTSAEQARQFGFFFVDDGVEAAIGLLVAHRVGLGGDQHHHALAVGRPDMAQHACVLEPGDAAIGPAGERHGIDAALFVLARMEEADPRAIGRKLDVRHAHIVGQIGGRPVRPGADIKLRGIAAIVFAAGHIGPSALLKGDPRAVGRHREAADRLQARDVFRRHLARFGHGHGGDERAGKQGGLGQFEHEIPLRLHIAACLSHCAPRGARASGAGGQGDSG